MVFVQSKGNEMKLTDIKNSLNEISAIGGLKQVVKGNTDRVEGIKLSKEMAQAMIDWFNSSPYGRKYPNAKKGRLNLSLGIMGHFGLDRYAKHKGAKEELKYIKTLSKAMRDNVNEALNERAEPMLSDKEQEIVRKSLQRAVGVDVDSEPDDTRYHGGNSNFIFDGGEDLMLFVGKYEDEDKPYYVSIEGFDAGKVADEDAKDFKGIVKAAMKMAKKYKKRLTTESKAMRDNVNESKFAGWIAGYNGKQIEIKKGEAKDLYNAKLLAIKKLKVPKSKVGLMFIKPAVDESVVNEAKYDIGMARKGNGLTVYNKAEEEKGDYKNVAHIDSKGKIKYYDKKVPSNIKKQIEAEAKKMMEIKIEGTIKLTDMLKEAGKHKSKDSRGIRFAEAIYNNVEAIIKAVEREKMDVDRVVNSFGPVLVNAIKTTLKHKFKPTAGNEDKLDDFYDELKELLKVAESLVKRPSKAGIKKLDASHREWWNHNGGADVVLNGKYADNIIESKGNTMKLKDLLNESFEGMRIQASPSYNRISMREDDRTEESSEMTTEQKQAFLEAVKSYKKFGESVYRKEGLSKVYESIRGLVEVAGKNMVKETEGSFDGITVGRHVKRMNESFKIFEKTLREVSTLQQRLESSYDEIGETLGKYYEINELEEKDLEEGNEFGAARTKAIANGDSEFEVDGKKYPVKDVSKDDKDNAKEFTKESKGTMKLKDLLKESFGFGELPSSKLIKMKVSAKDMLASVNNKKINESDEVEEEKINEGGFATWEMSFADMNLGGVKLSKKNVYKVKARNTVEAIKKAAKMAGVGDSWIATQTHSLKKIG
jgi:hypothetical protein